MAELPTLPNYELVSERGRTVFVRTFVARHRAGQFPCLVKLLQPARQFDPLSRQLLINEGRAGLAVRHRRLVKTLDARTSRDLPFVVLEFRDDESLARRLQRAGRFDWPGVLQVARQVAEALTALHDAGFVHANVCPTTIALDADDSGVLTDLGCTHRPGELLAWQRLGVVLGDASHRAPELVGTAAGHTLASDWFSYGLSMLQLAAGRLLPNPAAGGERLASAMNWPGEFRRLIVQLLAPRPTDRPTGREVLAELGEIAAPALLRLPERRAA